MEILPSRDLSSLEFGSKETAEVGGAPALRSPTKKGTFERNQIPEGKMDHQKFMSVYKVNECKKKFNHDKRQCLNWHSQADRRRNPFDIDYSTTECENGLYCKDFSKCLFSHNMLEKMFHPDLFKITRCIRGPNCAHREREDFCAFAHSADDLRHPVKEKGVAGLSVATANDIDHYLHQKRRLQSPGRGISFKGYSGTDGLSPPKPLTLHSTALENIQRNLVTLIKSQGVDGIISSELPKRYFDYFGSRLDLQDENGEKFRIKDILHKLADVTVSMHKGVQPKYVYSGPDPFPISRTGGNGADVEPSLSDDTSNQTIEDKSKLSFLAAASGRRSPTEETDIEDKSCNVSSFPIKGNQPSFSPAGIGHPGQFFSHGNAGKKEDFMNSPFFADQSSSHISQTEFSGLLGKISQTTDPTQSTLQTQDGGNNSDSFDQGLMSPNRQSENKKSSSSYLDETFKFPLFENSPAVSFDRCNESQNFENISRLLIEKNSVLNAKSMEIEDLKGKLLDMQLLHTNTCIEHDKEKRQLLLQISELRERNSSLQQSIFETNASNYDGQFPQNAFPMNSSGQSFTPRNFVSTSSSTSPSSSSGSWSAESGNMTYSKGRSQLIGQASNSQCGLNGCSVEGTYLCSGCNRIGYCGPEHQAEHWCYHKNECGFRE